ncbi:menaquinone biosynthesis protein [Streptomyces luteosporeus]|uniref:Chorismate dehydratase n=1 Tax=Streptomyces luteosporeus TaxID=173856 RepID=A0ABP6GL45_9ACTN
MGHIAFLNCLPLLWGLARTGSLLDLDLTTGHPARLGAALLSGELDIGPVSLADYLGNTDRLVALPDIAIGSDGPVMSCLIVSRVPLAELDGRTVSLCSTSRTSVRLARLLLRKRIGVEPRYRVRPPDLRVMLSGADAAVLIGDPALRAALLRPAPAGVEVHDLGRLWREWTGLPFVFALFAARRELVERDPATVREVHAQLLAARDLGLREVDRLCGRAARWEPFDAATLRHYFTRALDYGLGPRQLLGIAQFTRLAGGPDAGFPADAPLDLLERADTAPGSPGWLPRRNNNVIVE